MDKNVGVVLISSIIITLDHSNLIRKLIWYYPPFFIHLFKTKVSGQLWYAKQRSSLPINNEQNKNLALGKTFISGTGRQHEGKKMFPNILQKKQTNFLASPLNESKWRRCCSGTQVYLQCETWGKWLETDRKKW